MSQNNECGCGHPQLTMLPVHGFGLAVDASGLVPAPVPTPTGRERVDHDMHIYVNGNLAESGDGLSPETAVKSYEDAILALSRYDGCNMRVATIHFADLDDPEAVYPDMTISTPNYYSTFRALTLTGVSHETTMLGKVYTTSGAYCTLTNACVSYIMSTGWLNIDGKVALKPRLSEKAALHANWGGSIRFLQDSDLYLHQGQYMAAVYSICGYISNSAPMKFHTLGNASMDYGFAHAIGNGIVRLTRTVDFSDCHAVTGRKYYVAEQASVITGGAVLPGSLPGVTANKGLYL